MENGDSDTDKYPHRTGNIAGHDFVHGTWAVQFLRKPLPCPSPKWEGLFVYIKKPLTLFESAVHCESRGDSNAAITCKNLQITASSSSILFIVMQKYNF